MASTLDRYCGSTFWNSSLLETETPDLTVCFEQTVLVWAPLSLLWLLAAPIQLANLWRVPSVTRPVQRRRFSFLYIAKQVTLVLLFVSAVAALGITLSEDFGPMCDPKPCDVSAPMLYVNPCLYMLTWLLLLVLGEVARRRGGGGGGGGGLLFLFWLLLVLCGALPLQTLVRQLLAGVEGGGERHWVFFVSFGLQVQALVLSAFADSASEPEETKPCQFKPNPTARASFLNLITFTWFDKMVYRGYRRPLEMSDLCELDSEDEAGRVIGQLGRSWRREERRGAAATGVTTGATTATDLTGKSTEFLVMEPFSEPDVGYGSGGGGGDDAAAAGGSGAGGKPSLFRAMLRTYRRPLIESAIFKLIYDLLVFVNPQILKAMISFTDDPRVYEWKGYVYAVVLLITALLQSVLQQQYFLRCFLIGMRVRSATIGLVYQKSLTISNGARKRCAAGETVNLMSADAQRFMDVAPFLHLVWSAPLQIALSLAFLWAELGPASLAGLAVMVLVVPVNALLATRSRLLQMQNMKVKDERIKLMNEILNGIKILKYFAWEPSFEEMVTEIRDRELGVMKSFSYLTSVSFFIFALTPFLVSLASFGVYIAVDARHVLDAPRAFTSLALFNVMRYPMAMIPLLISFLVQAGVSVGRMEKFLMNDDIDASSIQKNPDLDCAIRIENASFAWEREDPQPTLKDLSLVIPFGSLVAVVGQVGSGKSSLIAAMLGEMERLHGSIELKGSLAYVPQQAWIQNATLQDNVLFGTPMERARYAEVLQACALVPDLLTLPAGDQTEIGEKGVNLSGGQRQRVSLARAVYSSADLFLLDDPLSAVDAHVAKHLFSHVVGPRGLLKGKTRVLVTHSVSVLPLVDVVVVLTAGRISEVGPYQQLVSEGRDFAEFLRAFAGHPGPAGPTEETAEHDTGTVLEEDELAPLDPCPRADEVPGDMVTMMLRRHSSQRIRSASTRLRAASMRSETQSVYVAATATTTAAEETTGKSATLIERENIETGNVKMRVYLQYVRAMGPVFPLLILAGYFLQTVASIAQNFWLSAWTGDAQSTTNTTAANATANDADKPTVSAGVRIAVYGVLGLAQGMAVLLGSVMTAVGTIRAARVQHSGLLHNVLRLPMAFFDTTPMGRIVNRFAKDMNTIDEMIPMSVRPWLISLFSVLGTVVVICVATPVFTAIVVPLAILYFFLQRFYMKTSRQLRRLDAVSRSPVYSHLEETVQGLGVIRAYGHAERFLRHNESLVQRNQLCVFPWVVSNRWLSIRLDVVGALVVFFSSLFAVLARGAVDGAIVGLSISYSLTVTQTLNWLVQQTCELETNIVAVERVREYSEEENEAAWVVEETRPPEGWPSRGAVVFEDFAVRYRPGLRLVLQAISCSVLPGEKIGIVGRTGAGKSSLASCLFRLVEPAHGAIRIDGVDIARLGLHDLRSKLTIIPQDPVIFSGSLRTNLDPLGQHGDEALWAALEQANLGGFARGLPQGLTHRLSEGGDNLSVGQRQLLCLARALLRGSRVLILDEATAAVDLETDGLIQSTLRGAFHSQTVLTIAHRLHTVMDYTRILVLDAGRIVEFDSPGSLMERRGVFYRMARDAGIGHADHAGIGHADHAGIGHAGTGDGNDAGTGTTGPTGPTAGPTAGTSGSGTTVAAAAATEDSSDDDEHESTCL